MNLAASFGVVCYPLDTGIFENRAIKFCCIFSLGVKPQVWVRSFQACHNCRFSCSCVSTGFAEKQASDDRAVVFRGWSLFLRAVPEKSRTKCVEPNDKNVDKFLNPKFRAPSLPELLWNNYCENGDSFVYSSTPFLSNEALHLISLSENNHEKHQVIAFDADDTLWDNEIFFQQTKKILRTAGEYLPQHSVARELLQTEVKNIPLYGYGIKAFILSMIETAIRVSDKTINVSVIETIIAYGQELLDKPIQKIDGVDEVLTTLQDKYRLVVATKGDLLDQERKLKSLVSSTIFTTRKSCPKKVRPTIRSSSSTSTFIHLNS